MTGKEVAKAISDYVNSCPTSNHEEFIKAVLSDHRTLQQSTIRLCFSLIKAMAQQNCIDDRNQDSVTACNTIVERCSHEMSLRFI